jgi:hypothetical protein
MDPSPAQLLATHTPPAAWHTEAVDCHARGAVSVASAHSCSAPGCRESGAREEPVEELSGCQDLNLADTPQGEQVLVAGDDDVGV